MNGTDWPSAIAHIDADCFYASCERARRPELARVPVCVLSNQNAFVVAKSYDAKARGITTGMPLWQARRLVPQALFLPPDFRFYGLMSERLFAILRRFSPLVEAYSIDEGFLDLAGLHALWPQGFRPLADDIRRQVQREVGITVSVGVGTSKTLAKIAAEQNKPNGSTIIPGRRIGRLLAKVAVGDIPGIGRRRAELLGRQQIATAWQFAACEAASIERLLGRHGLTLWHELRGEAVLPVVSEAPMPKSVARTSSTGGAVFERAEMAAWLAHHCHRLVAELVAKRLIARRLTVFLTDAAFEAHSVRMRLPQAGNSLKEIGAAAHSALGQLWRDGEGWRGSGVVADELLPEAGQTLDLFGGDREALRQRELMYTLSAINRHFGNGAIGPGSELRIGKGGSTALRFRYPLLLARG